LLFRRKAETTDIATAKLLQDLAIGAMEVESLDLDDCNVGRTVFVQRCGSPRFLKNAMLVG
jgi:hypothetical protein